MATIHQNLSEFDGSNLPDASALSFGIVVAEWNANITKNLYKGAYQTLVDSGVEVEKIIKWEVPGAFELTFGCKKIIETHQPDAVIAIGSVIRGETSHFDFVCQGVTQGITQLNLLYDTPVVFCVLTDDHIQQSLDRSGGKHGNKGVEAAVAAIKMAVLGKE
ncbi:MAG: 6,7-dimethyl-8-ribityllumazine synthase [Flavobacteriaceae bacterium]|nr:6,7-dimethyl-8-ribityllumazine synthase [Flavobacteriaceae bacterium]